VCLRLNAQSRSALRAPCQRPAYWGGTPLLRRCLLHSSNLPFASGMQAAVLSFTTMPATCKNAASRAKNPQAARNAPTRLASTAILLAAITTDQPNPSNQANGWDGWRGGPRRLPDDQRRHTLAPSQPRANRVLRNTTANDEASEWLWNDNVGVQVGTVRFHPSPQLPTIVNVPTKP